MDKKFLNGGLLGATAYLIQGVMVWNSPYKDLVSQYFNPASAKQEDLLLMTAGSLDDSTYVANRSYRTFNYGIQDVTRHKTQG